MSTPHTTTRLPSITIVEGMMRLKISVKDILFIRAEHIYIRIHLVNSQQLLHRISLSEFLSKLPRKDFVQVHRSFVVNRKQIDHWDNTSINIQGSIIPISRSRRKMIDHYLLTQ